MEHPPDKYQKFWHYLSQTQRDLILEGEYLMNNVIKENAYRFKDYSFLVFPFAKAYEGFLKQLFKDAKFISHLDYISDHLRLGKLMSPHLAVRLGERSLYVKVRDRAGIGLADHVWNTWKAGRNLIFHYFPHNLRAIGFDEAEKIVNEIIVTMEEAYDALSVENAASDPETSH